MCAALQGPAHLRSCQGSWAEATLQKGIRRASLLHAEVKASVKSLRHQCQCRASSDPSVPTVLSHRTRMANVRRCSSIRP